MRIEQAAQLQKLPPYLFAEIERKVASMKARGETVYDLSIGDPDIPTPPNIVRVMQRAMAKQENQTYSSSRGEPYFREAVAEWYGKRFGAKLDASKEVCALIGSKEGIANIARAFVVPGDTILVPDPGYPVYANGATLLCAGFPEYLPLLEENGFLPDLENLNAFDIRLMYLNYPNNPTGAVATKSFMKCAVDFCRDNGIILCYDNAYSEICFEKGAARSILEIPGAYECAVEFNSCSKMFNMTGSRIGFAVGNEKVIAGLSKVKSQIDSGPSPFIQRAGAYALSLYRGRSPPDPVKRNIQTYRRRMKILVDGLNRVGIRCRPSPGTFYLWVNVGGSSMDFAAKLLDLGIVVTPGIGFGKHGEGYVRFALTRDEGTLRKVVEKLENADL